MATMFTVVFSLLFAFASGEVLRAGTHHVLYEVPFTEYARFNATEVSLLLVEAGSDCSFLVPPTDSPFVLVDWQAAVQQKCRHLSDVMRSLNALLLPNTTVLVTFPFANVSIGPLLYYGNLGLARQGVTYLVVDSLPIVDTQILDFVSTYDENSAKIKNSLEQDIQFSRFQRVLAVLYCLVTLGMLAWVVRHIHRSLRNKTLHWNMRLKIEVCAAVGMLFGAAATVFYVFVYSPNKIIPTANTGGGSIYDEIIWVYWFFFGLHSIFLKVGFSLLCLGFLGAVEVVSEPATVRAAKGLMAACNKISTLFI